jgi:hypothetical protein
MTKQSRSFLCFNFSGNLSISGDLLFNGLINLFGNLSISGNLLFNGLI